MTLPDHLRYPIRLAIWVVAYLAACWAFVAVRDWSLLVSVLAILAVVGAARQLHTVIRAGRPESQLLERLGWAVPVGLGLAILAAWQLGLGDGWGFFGVAVLYLGLGLLVDQLRATPPVPATSPLPAPPPFFETWGPRILGGAAALVVLAVVGLALLGAGWVLPLLIAGVVVGIVGLSLVSESAIQGRRKRWGSPAARAVVGLACFAGGLVVMLVLGVGAGYVAALAVAVFVLVLAIAARSNADVVLVVAVAAVVWTLAHRSVPVTDAMEANQPGEEVVVALGDSYTSGEGADKFFAGTNDKGDNECRRAPTAYPALLMLDSHPAVPNDLAFLACSGATTAGVREQLAEFTRLRSELGLDVWFVLVGIGGNDALFGSVGRTCLLPGDCSKLGPAWARNLEEVGGTLQALYGEVREAAAGAPVLVVPYPIPIREKRCGYSAFSGKEHEFLHQYTVALNRVVQRAAAAAGVHYVSNMADAMLGWRLCDAEAGQAGVNFLATNTVVGTLEQTVNPFNWFHNSLHPNARGHELMHRALITWIDANPDLGTVSTEAPTGEAPSEEDGSVLAGAGACGPCQGLLGEELETCTNRWLREEVGTFLLTRGGPLLLVIGFGAWLLAVSLIRLWRLVFGPPPTGPAQPMAAAAAAGGAGAP